MKPIYLERCGLCCSLIITRSEAEWMPFQVGPWEVNIALCEDCALDEEMLERITELAEFN